MAPMAALGAARMTAQTMAAISTDADVCVFVIDARDMVTAE